MVWVLDVIGNASITGGSKMQLPFSPEQFFAVFAQYNQAVWPAQIGLNLVALAGLYFLARPRPASGRLVSGLLALLWAWTGIAYHLAFFTAINKAAYGFGAVFLLGAAAFLWAGVVRGRLEFTTTGSARRLLGYALVAFALLVYPLLSSALGHGYPAMPTFGLPCPTTIFTIGLLCFLSPPFPRWALAAPVLWAAVGSQAAFLLGVYQDLGLLAAGLVGIGLALQSQRRVTLR